MRKVTFSPFMAWYNGNCIHQFVDPDMNTLIPLFTRKYFAQCSVKHYANTEINDLHLICKAWNNTHLISMYDLTELLDSASVISVLLWSMDSTRSCRAECILVRYPYNCHLPRLPGPGIPTRTTDVNMVMRWLLSSKSSLNPELPGRSTTGEYRMQTGQTKHQ